MKDVDVNTESFRQAKVLIGNSTQETDAALSAFIAELEGFGEPWGNDDLGALIGLSYQGIFEVAMDCFASNLDVIDSYAERLGAAADEIDRTDSDRAQVLNQAQANMPQLPL
jgi:glycogen debranching enzyme